jgi:KaiC/GvpD/RAD55 family RecA-like ATPase
MIEESTEESRMEIDRNATATKGDLQDLKDEILATTKGDLQDLKDEILATTKGDLQGLRDELKGDIQGLRDELLEAFRDGQTEMLRAFYSFAQSTDVKLKETELDDMMLRQRLTAVEMRLTEVEKRLHLPPAA